MGRIYNVMVLSFLLVTPFRSLLGLDSNKQSPPQFQPLLVCLNLDQHCFTRDSFEWASC